MMSNSYLVENYICHVCNKLAATDCIYCELCNTWLHKTCLKLSQKCFKILGSSPYPYYCPPCFQPILAFSSISNKAFFDVHITEKTCNMKNKRLNCNQCNKTFKPNQIKVQCTLCFKHSHQHCLKIEKSELKKSNFKHWICNKCFSFPFNDIDNEQLNKLSYNSLIVDNFTKIKHTDEYSGCNIPNLSLIDPVNFENNDNPNEININFSYNRFYQLYNLLQHQAVSSFSVFHSNIRSINKNLDELSALLSNLDHGFDVVGLSELWQPEDPTKLEKTFSLQGYHDFQMQKGSSQNSGCGIFIKKHLKYKVRNELNFSFSSDTEEFQIFFTEILFNVDNIIVGTIYRHPKGNSLTEFQKTLKNILKIVQKENKKIVIMGDFNIDLLHYNNHNDTENFLNLMLQNLLIPQITGPTRINDNGNFTLIDNIFFSDPASAICSGNLLCQVSDHLPNFLKFEHNNEIKDEKTYKRDFSKYNPQKIKTDFQNLDLVNKFQNYETVDGKYDLLHRNLENILDLHVPLKEFKQKTKEDKPWINERIIKLIREKSRINQKYYNTGNPEYKKTYKIAKNKVNHEIRRSKYNYFKNFFENNQNNIKKHWNAVNLILSKKKKDLTPSSILKNGNLITDPEQIAETINKYYTNVAPDLVRKLPKSKSVFSTYLKKMTSPVDSFYCRLTNEEEVGEVIESLNQNKTEDIYRIPIRVLKDLKEGISEPLAEIFNTSFSKGVFPDKLKLAKVIPLHKGGDQSTPKNFRPISILPIFDKILEKLMHSRLISYIKKHKILNNAQYGFQKHKSTSMAIIDLLDKVSQSLKNKSFSCCVFLDLAKAFDTVSHEILLKKLEHYGIRGISNNWFRSYLSNRKQSVSVNNKLSTELPISYGVPQGSILGPLLFILYINDIIKSSNKLYFVQFADDTCLFMKNKNKTTLADEFNSELASVSDWLVSNKLSLNVNKSNFLFFSNQRDKEPPELKMQNTVIENKEVVKYLGVLIDNKLKWTQHIKSISQKISRGIGILHSTKFLVPHSILLNLYFAFIQSHLLYGILAWGSPLSHLGELNKIVNKAEKIINKYCNSNILHLDQLYQIESCKLIFKFKHKILPKNIEQMIKQSNLLHQINTRQADNQGMFINHINTYFPLKTLSCRFWNVHCHDLFQPDSSISLFTKSLKERFLQQDV